MTTPTKRPQRVRIAEPLEEESVMELCRELYNENGMFHMSEVRVRDMLARAFNRMGGLLGVIGPPGHLEGMIYLLMSSMWYSDEPHWEELFTYVRPQFRRSRNAIDLLHFSKWAAEESGIPLLIGVLSNEQTERKVQLYQRQFSNPVGNFFLYKTNGSTAVH